MLFRTASLQARSCSLLGARHSVALMVFWTAGVPPARDHDMGRVARPRSSPRFEEERHRVARSQQ